MLKIENTLEKRRMNYCNKVYEPVEGLTVVRPRYTQTAKKALKNLV
jgi:hypothetical protein